MSPAAARRAQIEYERQDKVRALRGDAEDRPAADKLLAPVTHGFERVGGSAERLADVLTGAAARIAGGPASATSLPFFAGGAVPGSLTDPRGMLGVINQAANENGLNSAALARIAQSEGLGSFYGDKNTSFGALQLHVGGGLGDDFKRQTGLDPSDKDNEAATIKWAAQWMAQHRDISPWHGAARVGVTNSDVFGSGAQSADLLKQTESSVNDEAALKTRASDTQAYSSAIKEENLRLAEQRAQLDTLNSTFGKTNEQIIAATEYQRLYQKVSADGNPRD